MCVVNWYPCLSIVILLMYKVDEEVNPCGVGTPCTLELSLQQIEEIKAKDLQREKSELRTAYGITEDINSVLSILAYLCN